MADDQDTAPIAPTGPPVDLTPTDATAAPPVAVGGAPSYAFGSPDLPWPPPTFGQGFDGGLAPVPMPGAPPPDANTAASSAATDQGSAGGGPQSALDAVGATPVQLPPPPAPATPPGVDAVTGGEPQSHPGVTPQQDEAAAQQHTTTEPEQQVADDQDLDKRAEFYATHPEQAAADELKAQAWKADRQRELDRQDAEARIKSAQQLQQNLQWSHDEGMKTYNDAVALSKTKINGGLSGLGTGKAIVGVLMAGLGGALQSANGGRNLGLDSLTKAIDNNVKVQQMNLDNGWKGIDTRNNLIAQQMARGKDLFTATETVRMAMHQSALDQLDQEAQNYDPRGQTARMIGAAKAQIRAQQAQSQFAVQQKLFEDKNAADKTQLETVKTQLDAVQKEADRNAADVRSRREVGLGYYRAGLEDARARDTHEDAVAAREEARQERLAQHADGTIGGGVVGVNADGTPRFDVMRQEGGEPWKVMDEKQREKVTQMLAGTDDLNTKANRLAREISSWGGQSSTLKGKRYQQMIADYNALFFALHDAKGIESFRPGTVESMHELTADVDPTSFLRDAAPGILRARDNVNEALNAHLTRLGYTGKPYSPTDTSSPPAPEKSDIDEAAAGISGSTKGIQHEARWDHDDPDDRALAGAMPINTSINPLSSSNKDPDDLTASERRVVAQQLGDRFTPIMAKALDNGLTPSQQKHFDLLENTLTSTDPGVTAAMRKSAQAQLGELATDAPTSRLRSYAANLILGAGMANTASAADENKPRGGTSARDRQAYDRSPEK